MVYEGRFFQLVFVSYREKSLFIYALTHTLVHVYTVMHVVLIPVFMKEFNLSPSQVGLLVSIPLFCQICTSIPSGLFADRAKRKSQVTASLILVVLAAFLVSQSSNFVMLILSASLIMVSSQLYHPPILSMVSELFPPKYRSRTLGLCNMGGTVGIALGSISLGILMKEFSWRSVYLLWVIPVLILIAIYPTKIVYEGKENNLIEQKKMEKHQDVTWYSGILEVLKGEFLILLLVMAVRAIGIRSVSTFFTTYLSSVKGVSVANASLIFGLNSLVGVAGNITGGVFGDRLGEKTWITVALTGSLLSILTVSLTPLWILFPSYLLYGYFNNSTTPATTSLVARFSPKSRRGIAYALFFLPFNATGSIAPVIAGKIVEIIGIWYIFPFAIIMFLISIVLIQMLKTERIHREE